MLLSTLQRNLDCRSRAVMSVRNVGGRNRPEALRDSRNLCLIRNTPHAVANAVLTHKIVKRRLLLGARLAGLQSLGAAIGEEDGAGLRVHDVHVAYAIPLLFLSRVFVLPNHLIQVVVHRRAGDQTGLAVSL